MRKENRKYHISRGYQEVYFNRKGNIIMLECGTADTVRVFRYDDFFFVMSKNEHLGYAGFELLYEHKTDGKIVRINSGYFDRLYELEEACVIKKPFFEYSENKQADVLAGWI